jgi:hypothetical protein
MSSRSPLLPPEFESEEVEIPEWHWEILDKRMADPSEDFENGITWEEFMNELDKELRQN